MLELKLHSKQYHRLNLVGISQLGSYTLLKWAEIFSTISEPRFDVWNISCSVVPFIRDGLHKILIYIYFIIIIITYILPKRSVLK